MKLETMTAEQLAKLIEDAKTEQTRREVMAKNDHVVGQVLAALDSIGYTVEDFLLHINHAQAPQPEPEPEAKMIAAPKWPKRGTASYEILRRLRLGQKPTQIAREIGWRRTGGVYMIAQRYGVPIPA